jgi:hypothetical protein
MKKSYIHSIEFNLDFYPDPLETWEIAKEILESKAVKQGVKEIQYTGNKVIYTTRPNFKGIYIPEEYYKGIIVNYISK